MNISTYKTRFALIKYISILLLLINFNSSSFSQAGTLDNTFGVNGKAITSIGNYNDGINSMAIQQDCKIILGGNSQSSFSFQDVLLMRYNTNGTLDNTFGQNGILVSNIESYSVVNAIAIQNDGKILVGGYSGWFISLVRYNNDGSLDTSFGDSGKVITDIEGFYSESCNSIVIQNDDKILIGGYGQHNSSDIPYMLMVRYNTDGSLDNTFGTNGKAIGSQGKANGMAIQSDGKILLAGTYTLSFAIERYNVNGSIDSSYAVNGKSITQFDNYSEATSIIIQNDGKVLLAGFAFNNANNSDFAIARFNTDGNIDDTFGINGKFISSLGNTSPQNRCNTMGIEKNGKILIAGSAINSSNFSEFALLRCNSNGTIDNTFGTEGKVLTAIGTTSSYGNAMLIQEDGKVLLAGNYVKDSTTGTALVRYNTDALLGVKNQYQHSLNSIIYPNPITSISTIKFDTPVHNAELIIYSLSGQEVLRIKNITSQELQLSCNDLAIGSYFFQVIEKNKIIAKNKFSVSIIK